MQTHEFQARVLAWFDQHGRKNLPWQINRNPYRVWVSEIMLQQTQVATVIPYYLKFVARFPDVHSLAHAELDEVIAHWAGLGYYARARNLHRAAIQLRQVHGGDFPGSAERLQELPGIGRSTAGAILSLGLNQRAAILDGNVRRVLCRYAGIEGWSGATVTTRRLWALSDSLTPVERVADYNQAMMDLGAMVCTRHQPGCGGCPLASSCVARRTCRTQAIPAPRPGRTMPVRECFMLVLRDPEHRVWLETRPPAGIWGGLKSLPEFATLDDLKAWCIPRRIGLEPLQPMARRRHTFSHYHLDFRPVLGRASAFGGVNEDRNCGWFHPEDSVGLPAPIRKLLTELSRA